MSVTVLNLTEASTLLRTINKRDIKDVRAIDNDLALVMENGHKIIISRGAVTAVNSPQLVLEFADGDVALGDVFEKLNHIEVPNDATAPLTASEVKRYGIKRVVKAKDTAKDKDEEQAEARAEVDDGKPVATLASDGALKQPLAASEVAQKSAIPSSSLTEGSSTEAADNGGGLSFSWPAVAGGLGLLAAAAGGGGGGGGGQSGAAAVPKAGTTLSGATVLGPLNNATITAYDSQGNVIGKPVPVINGRYSLVLDQPDYKGLILLAVRDNTPGVADNFADEATLRITDLGNTVLRSVVLADGSNQTINVTALTELAVLKAGLASGQTNLAASQISVTKATGANAAVSALFKVNITAGEVLATSITDSNGAAVVNPDFARGSTAARNYGIALKAISNLSQTDPARYPDQGTAIRKLADSLQFDDAAKPKWSDAVTQSDLFNERLNTRANDPTLSETERNQARNLLASLQKLPDGSTVNDHLLTNHIGILEPTILIRNATPGASPWQAPADGKLVLDETELSNGGLAVKAPPQARVEVTLIGQNAQGQEIVVRLPASIADGNGIAVLRADQAALDLFKQMTREQPVTARVTVTDGDTSRSNQNVWKGNADVHIDVVTPPGLTDFADNKIALVNDSFYGGADGDTTALGSNSDRVTNDAAVRVLLTRVLKPEERLEFQMATTTGANNAPVYGNWFTPADLKATAPDSNGQVGYVSSKLPLTEGQVWLKARIVRTAAQSGVAQGSTRELGSELKFTLDKTAPAQVPLRMEASGDDGISSADGISSQTGILLSPQLPLENGAEVHLRLLAGSGTDGNTLQLVHANGSQEALTPGNWVRWQSGDQLRLIGQTLQGNGKARLQVRQIDAAGNFTDSTQSFVADSTRVIEQVVLLASREQALNQAKAAVIAAQEAYDSASAADKPTRQASLTAAQTRLQDAQIARDQAPEQVRLGLLKSNGTTRLSDLTGTVVDPALLPAILRAVAATADPEQVNDAASLRTLVSNVVTAANTVLAKTSVYGDNDTNPAPTTADFERLARASSMPSPASCPKPTKSRPVVVWQRPTWIWYPMPGHQRRAADQGRDGGARCQRHRHGAPDPAGRQRRQQRQPDPGRYALHHAQQHRLQRQPGRGERGGTALRGRHAPGHHQPHRRGSARWPAGQGHPGIAQVQLRAAGRGTRHPHRSGGPGQQRGSGRSGAVAGQHRADPAEHDLAAGVAESLRGGEDGRCLRQCLLPHDQSAQPLQDRRGRRGPAPGLFQCGQLPGGHARHLGGMGRYRHRGQCQRQQSQPEELHDVQPDSEPRTGTGRHAARRRQRRTGQLAQFHLAATGQQERR
ncbi:hypothetical protein [uncultured Herbaspirillum sp.]|uniref:hypothetical protein n=1 Tax=uncultured Herbaspirillum sp. TaxID=160236 RepID=UPI00262DF678|nr:hypothetical protein [uncultured Herbaspirillum sp.]